MKKQLIAVFFVLAVLLLVISGCKQAPAGGEAAAELTDADLSDLEDSVDDFSSLEEELDISELDALEEELADIDELEIE